MVWLHTLKWPHVADYLRHKNIILLPVGSTEQHGRHAPLGTDTLIASRLAEDAASRTSVLCAPPLPFGWSPHHLVLPGTISIEPDTLRDLVVDVIRSLTRHGFANFVLVNGHRITNLPWLQLAAQRAQAELRVTVLIFDPAFMAKEIASTLGFGTIGHADELETSQLLFLAPDLVELSQAVDSLARDHPLYHVDPRVASDTLCYVPSTVGQMEQVVQATGGSTGTPTISAVEPGRRLHEHLLARLVAVIESLA